MVGLGPVRNQVSAAKKLQTPSRTATTIIMLVVAFVVLNKLLPANENSESVHSESVNSELVPSSQG